MNNKDKLLFSGNHVLGRNRWLAGAPTKWPADGGNNAVSSRARPKRKDVRSIEVGRGRVNLSRGAGCYSRLLRPAAACCGLQGGKLKISLIQVLKHTIS